MNCLVQVLSQHNLISTDAIVTTKLLKISILQLIPAVLYSRKILDQKKEKLTSELEEKTSRIKGDEEWQDIVYANVDNPLSS